MAKNKKAEKKIKLCIVDCDGVLTSGEYQVSNNGVIIKTFQTRDFYALEQLQKRGIEVWIVTQSDDRCINVKVDSLPPEVRQKLQVFSGIQNKFETIEKNLKNMGWTWENVAYIGDADNDVECMGKAKFIGCPSDALFHVRELVEGRDSSESRISDIVGGKGCVYDLVFHLIGLGLV